MKQRLISAAVGLAVLFVVIANFDSIILNFAICFVILLSIDELLSASDLKSNRAICFVTHLFGAFLPFLKVNMFANKVSFIMFFFAFAIFVIMLRYHTTLDIRTVGFAIAFTIAISLSATCIVYMRDLYGDTIGLYAILVSLIGAWMSDTGAFFAGVMFGKHKLAPQISPKKTIEGAIGGVVISTLSQILFAWLYTILLSQFGIASAVNYKLLILLSPFISVVSMVGDLTASIIKRQCKIKDFGKIMPGHGGVLDRFDSVFMVLPFVYNIFMVCPLIRIL